MMKVQQFIIHHSSFIIWLSCVEYMCDFVQLRIAGCSLLLLVAHGAFGGGIDERVMVELRYA